MLDIQNVHAEATLDTTDLDKLNNFVNTYLDCRKNSPKFTLVAQGMFPNFFPCVYLFISRIGFKSGMCLLVTPVPVHFFSITFTATENA